MGKTKAIRLGSWRLNKDKPLTLNWVNEPVRVLGIFIPYNDNGNNKKNVLSKIDNHLTRNSTYGEVANFRYSVSVL